VLVTYTPVYRARDARGDPAISRRRRVPRKTGPWTRSTAAIAQEIEARGGDAPAFRLTVYLIDEPENRFYATSTCGLEGCAPLMRENFEVNEWEA
jgi:hypothetical protein